MLYLKLFHGRKNPSEPMDDWGSDGPIFGPYQYAQTTYSHNLKLGRDSDDVDELFVTAEDLIYYAGVYYGDWSVFPEFLLEKHDQSLHQPLDPNKTKPPQLQKDGLANDSPFPVKIIVYIKGGVCLEVKTNLPDDSWEYGLVDFDNEPDLPEGHVPYTKAKMRMLPSMVTMFELINAAQSVIANWESGDLAGSVRQMAAILAQHICRHRPVGSGFNPVSNRCGFDNFFCGSLRLGRRWFLFMDRLSRFTHHFSGRLLPGYSHTLVLRPTLLALR